MRIGLLCPEPLNAGGIGTYTATHAKALADLGHEVWIGLRDRDPAPFPHAGVELEAIANPEPYRLPAFNRHWGLSLGLLPWAERVARAISGRHFDVLEVPEWLAGGLFLGNTPPLVVRLHSHLKLVRRLNELPLTLDARLSGMFERTALRHAKLILSNSLALAAELTHDYRIPRSRIEVLPLGIELSRFSAPSSDLKARLGLAPEDVLGLFVGRLEKRKGVEDLITAFLQASNHAPRLHLALAGGDTETGPEGASMRAHLAARVSAQGLSERVHWLGNRSPQDMPGLYAGSDFLVAPSPFESFGLVYLESMACSRPIIACAAGGVPEIVEHGLQGLLVPPRSPLDLTDALVRLSSDLDLRTRMGMAGREKAQTFDARAIAERAVRFYEQALLPAQPLLERRLQ